MNIALITAAGVGSRMNLGMPKQFVEIDGKPVIVYTLEVFQNHPLIDKIVILCQKEYIDLFMQYAADYGLTKLNDFVVGGETGLDSIRNGVNYLSKHEDRNSIVLIHDGVRANLPAAMITRCIEKLIETKSNSVAAVPCVEAAFDSVSMQASSSVLDRKRIVRTQTPHGMFLGNLVNLFTEADIKGIKESVAICTLLAELGYSVYFYEGFERNFKITYQDDINIFRMYKRLENNGEI